LGGVGLGRRGSRLVFLALVVLMKDEDDRQDDQCREEGKPRMLLDVSSQVEEVPDRLREHHKHRGREADQQDPILTAQQVHGSAEA
jgi:hypothetical protein